MIIRPRDIYSEIAEKQNLPIDLIESVGSIVFEELFHLMNDPRELAYELPKFGTFNTRFKKFERYYENFKKQLDVQKPEALKQLEDNPEKFQTNTDLYNKMQEYRKEKQEKRDLRNGTNKPSEDKPEECS